MDNMTKEELKSTMSAYDTAKGSYTHKLDAAYSNYQGFPISSESEFWKHMAYMLAETADSLFKGMTREHNHMLAFKFELDKRQKEFGFEYKSPMEIDRQWEEHRVAVRAKLAELESQRKKQ